MKEGERGKDKKKKEQENKMSDGKLITHYLSQAE